MNAEGRQCGDLQANTRPDRSAQRAAWPTLGETAVAVDRFLGSDWLRVGRGTRALRIALRAMRETRRRPESERKR